MADDVTAERIRDTIVNQFSVTADMVTDESTLDSLGLDSFDNIELCLLLEEEFGIPDFNPDKFSADSTFADICKYVKENTDGE